MKVFLIILALILLLIAALLLIPVRVVIKFSKLPEETSYSAYVKVWFFKVFSLPSEKKRKKPKKEKPPKEKKSVKDSINGGLELYKLIAEDVKIILSYTSKHALKVEKLHFILNYGTGDAASTGVLYGPISGIVYGALGLLAHNHKTKDSILSVTPEFNNAVFKAQGECILKLQNVHIIVIATKLVKLIIKMKKRKERD